MSDNDTQNDANAHAAKHLTNDDFDSTISEGYTLIDFWAEWCGPCKIIAPAIEELAGEYDGKVTVAKLDVDAYPDLAMKYGIQGIPAIVLFKDGEIVDRLVGAHPKANIVQFLEERVVPSD